MNAGIYLPKTKFSFMQTVLLIPGIGKLIARELGTGQRLASGMNKSVYSPGEPD